MDDMAASASNQDALDQFYKEIMTVYKVRDEGPFSEFLGVVITNHDGDGGIGIF